MQKIIISFLLLFSVFNLYSQISSTAFLNNHIGHYKGDLVIETKKGRQIVPMEFQLLKTEKLDEFEYRLIYDGSPRNYTLIVKNDESGVLEIDENNGIKLPAKRYDTIIYSFFEVQNNLLSTRLQFVGDQLFFEILFSSANNKTITGGQTKDIPEVFGYPISTIQKATLMKEN